jgi:hypothetical protein
MLSVLLTAGVVGLVAAAVGWLGSRWITARDLARQRHYLRNGVFLPETIVTTLIIDGAMSRREAEALVAQWQAEGAE